LLNTVLQYSVITMLFHRILSIPPAYVCSFIVYIQFVTAVSRVLVRFIAADDGFIQIDPKIYR